MAGVPKTKRIIAEDYPKEGFLPQLLVPINQFLEDTVRALNRNLTVAENMSGDILTVTLDGNYPVDVRWTRPLKPVAAWIGQCKEVKGAHTNLSAGVFLDWEMKDNATFRINAVPGISPTGSAPFRITIVAITG